LSLITENLIYKLLKRDKRSSICTCKIQNWYSVHACDHLWVWRIQNTSYICLFVFIYWY